MGIAAIIDLIKTGFSFFTKSKVEVEKSQNELQTEKTLDNGETNREEIKQGKSWRSFLGYALAGIMVWNYVIVPVLAAFGIVVFTLPVSDIIRLLSILLTGN